METTKGMIFDIRKYSIHDGPGIRTTVFFKGCPLSCQWCHNPEGQSPAPELMFWDNRCIRCGKCMETCLLNAVYLEDGVYSIDGEHCIMCGDCIEECPGEAREIAGKVMTVAEVMAVIEQDIPFYDESRGGVTFSGGEPMLQRAFLLQLLKACKEKDIHTALDTCGFARWEVLDSLRPYVDLFLYDVKLMDEDKHRKYTGVSNKIIQENLRKLAELGHKIILRVPLIPGITDTEENIRQIGELAASLPSVQRVDILPYHETAVQKYHRLGMPYQLEGTGPEQPEVISHTTEILEDDHVKVSVGG